MPKLRKTLFSFTVFVMVVESVDFYSYKGYSINSHNGISPVPKRDFSPAENQLPIWVTNNTFVHRNRVTNLNGNPAPSLTASQGIGSRGYLLLQDFQLLDKLGHFVRERIPERVVHAKGAGAHGYFMVTHDVSKFTRADFLNGIGKKTPTFVRFSTVAGELGSADTLVDPHGFATKFYTQEGNHDLVGLNTEAFPIRDPMLFPDLNRSRKRNPATNMFDLNMWFDFVGLRPETTLNLLMLHSDLGRPDGYRRQDGFSIHAFKCVNAKGEVIFCKFIWKSLQRAPALTHEQSSQLVGDNPEYNSQDLYDAIAKGKFPVWELNLQLMTIEQAKAYPRFPFDTTKVWRREEFPLIPVGKMVLNRNPSNYFAEVEQAVFIPAATVPGIEPGPDRLLASRLSNYQDAMRYRITANGQLLPINRPIVEITSYDRNGLACYGPNGLASPNYYPNSFGGPEPDIVVAKEVPFPAQGIVDRLDIPDDEYIDSRLFLERDVDPEPGHRERLVSALAVRLKQTIPRIREQVLKNNLYPVSKSLGDQVLAAINEYLVAGDCC